MKFEVSEPTSLPRAEGRGASTATNRRRRTRRQFGTSSAFFWRRQPIKHNLIGHGSLGAKAMLALFKEQAIVRTAMGRRALLLARSGPTMV